MKWVNLKTFTFLAVNIYFGFAFSFQNKGNEGPLQHFDLLEIIKNSMEKVNTYQFLKLLSNNETAFVKEFEKFLSASINPVLLKMLPEVTSKKCVEDLNYVFQNLLFPSGWAIKMLDSYGKPESGILAGNIRWLGQYDECISIQVPSKKNNRAGGFNGKYCTLEIPINIGSLSLPISTAVCLPDSCDPIKTPFNIEKSYNFSGSAVKQKIQSILSNVTLTCKDTPRKLTTAAIVFICVAFVFVLLAVIGSSMTAFEYCMNEKSANIDGGCDAIGDPCMNKELDGEGLKFCRWSMSFLEKCKPFFNLFCVFTNGEKILNVSSDQEQFSFLHGIRFLSMTWVILCHVYAASTGFLSNTVTGIDYMNRWPIQIISNGFFSVDSFFILSGFLVAYVYFYQVQKTDGKFPWIYFYVHRYIRLAPAYFMVAAFNATISPFLGSGPLWPDTDVDEGCKEKWWTNVLFINNFLAVSSKKCMPWSWYLANDMQFFVISPLFLITLWRWPKAGYSLLGLGFCITFVCNFVITYEYDIIAGVGGMVTNVSDIMNFMPRVGVFFDKIYKKPYTRIGPYLVGLALAYYLHRRKLNKAHRLNWVQLSMGWIIASGITLLCQFGLYNQVLTTLEASFYNAFSRVGFSLGVSWVIFLCVIGQGGAVDSFLSWKAFIPLSRLSYCAYLIHPIIMTSYFLSRRTLMYFTHINMIMVFFGVFFISYAASFAISLLFESPFIRLDKFIRSKFAS